MDYHPLPSCFGLTRPGRLMVRDDDIDEDILPLVVILNSPISVTFSSCRGHDEDEFDKTSVSLAVHGMEGLEAIVLPLQQWYQLLEQQEIIVNLDIDWMPDVASACDFENHPDWISLNLTATNPDGDSLTKQQIEVLADIFRKDFPP